MQGRDRARFSPEFKDEAVRLVIESGRPIAQIAQELKINDGTLGNWVAKFRDAHPVSESPLTLSERAWLQELERENRQLRPKPSSWERPLPPPPSTTTLRIGEGAA